MFIPPVKGDIHNTVSQDLSALARRYRDASCHAYAQCDDKTAEEYRAFAQRLDDIAAQAPRLPGPTPRSAPSRDGFAPQEGNRG